MKSVEVKSETMSIKCDWNREMVSDLSSFHGFDLTQELESTLVKELRKSQRRNKISQRRNKISKILKG